MKLSDQMRRLSGNPIFGLLVLVVAFFVMVSILLWAVEKLETPVLEAIVVIPTGTPPAMAPPLPAIPTREEIEVASRLTSLHPQESPAGTVEVYKEILNALMDSRRGKIAEESEEEAPELLRRSSSSRSYID